MKDEKILTLRNLKKNLDLRKLREEIQRAEFFEDEPNQYIAIVEILIDGSNGNYITEQAIKLLTGKEPTKAEKKDLDILVDILTNCESVFSEYVNANLDLDDNIYIYLGYSEFCGDYCIMATIDNPTKKQKQTYNLKK